MTIHGMNGSSLWPVTNYIPPLPPLKRRMPGRPTVKRRRDASERNGSHTVPRTGKKVTCSICKQQGHNKSSCPVAEGPKKMSAKRKVDVKMTQESVNNCQGSWPVQQDLVEVTVTMDEQLIPATVNEAPNVGDAQPQNAASVPSQAAQPPSRRRRLQFGEGPSRKRSERLILKSLGKRVEGKGSFSSKPMVLH